MLEKFLIDSDPYLSCDDCFEQVDAAVEGLLTSDEAMTTALKKHLNACPACHEEALSLAELIAEDHDLTAEEGAARFIAESRAPSGHA